MKPLNIFYEEPDPDRWLPFDRFPRKIIRRLVRGRQKPGGVMMVALELMRGLDRLNISYRFNDYKYIKKHPEELVCLIGKPQLLFDRKWLNPIVFGAGIYSHPIECPNLFEKYPNVKKFLVPGEWMRKMCEPYYGQNVLAWPVGIDTEKWSPSNDIKSTDFLIYDKIRWDYDQYNASLISPIKQHLESKGYSYEIIKYGSYTHQELETKLARSKSVIFLCEHETQGLAYQQILATNTPILAWDRGGFWQDPAYFPNKVMYQPVSSVPYWDNRCGEKFTGMDDFDSKLEQFIQKIQKDEYFPREYILENLTLEKSALTYIDIINKVLSEDSSNC